MADESAEPTIKVTLTRNQALCLAGEYIPVLAAGESFVDVEVEAREVLMRELISHGLLDDELMPDGGDD